MPKNTTKGLSSVARQGFFAALLERAEKEGAFPLTLRAGGITGTEVHAFAVANGCAYINGVFAIDQRAKRPQAG